MSAAPLAFGHKAFRRDFDVVFVWAARLFSHGPLPAVGYLKRLHRWKLLERSLDRRGLLLYRLSDRGAQRLTWLRLGGHSSTTMTSTYLRTRLDTVTAAYEKRAALKP